MKAHYPVEFLAASMTLDMSNTDKINDFRQDATRLGIEVIAPSVQTSFRRFETGDNRIYYSLAAIKGVGEAAVDHIVEVRGDKPFASLEDFCLRIDPKLRQPPRLRKPDLRRRLRLFRLRPRRARRAGSTASSALRRRARPTR